VTTCRDVSTPRGCRICGGSPLIDAHLFPRALAHDLRGEEKHLFVGAAGAPGRRIVQAGLFDRKILCSEHEAALGIYDAYGIEFCRTFPARVQHVTPNTWRVRDVDGDLLSRFWLSVLWRFAVSTLPETALVQLGPYEDHLRDILFCHFPCTVEPAVMMLRYRSHVIPPENICFAPYKSKFPPFRFAAYSMAISGFHAFIKLDRQPLPRSHVGLTINGKEEICGGYLELEKTKQFQTMRRMVNNMGIKPSRVVAR
jgi:hypothetical protein